jgi:CheY-like chemotaxis protein
MIKEPEGEQVAVREFQVLVVDDEQSILDLTTEVLSGEGYKVKAMASPLDALRAIKLHRFDALILDIYMPELPGLLFHAKLKFLDSELARRTIFTSGHFNREELREHIEKSTLFLPKPFVPELLVAMLREVLPEVPRR